MSRPKNDVASEGEVPASKEGAAETTDFTQDIFES